MKQTKAKFSLRIKHIDRNIDTSTGEKRRSLSTLMLFSAGSRFRISYSFSKSRFFFPPISNRSTDVLPQIQRENSLQETLGSGRCGIIVPGQMLSRCCSKHKDCYFQYFKNVPLFNCSIIKNSCASSSQTNVSVMWENKLFFFFFLFSLTETQTHCRTSPSTRSRSASNFSFQLSSLSFS